MDFSIQNSVFCTRIASLSGPSPHLCLCAFTTATLWQELIVSMGPSHHLCFCAFTTATLWPELIVSMGPSPHLCICAFTTATLWPGLIVSMGRRPHQSYCACKTAWLVPELLSLHGSQTSPFILCMQNNVISIRISSLCPKAQMRAGTHRDY